jgi:hypothetical protein
MAQARLSHLLFSKRLVARMQVAEGPLKLASVPARWAIILPHISYAL